MPLTKTKGPSMAYVRLSMVHPRHGEEERVMQTMKSLAEAVLGKEGCLSSYVAKAKDGGDVARISTFTDEAAADTTANDAHVMALRSELNMAVDTHIERAFETI